MCCGNGQPVNSAALAGGPARRSPLISALSAALVFSLSAPAQQPPNAPDPARRAEGTTLAGQVDLPRLVDLAAERLRLNIEYDGAALKAGGSVTLRLEAGLSDEELWSLVNRVLATRGFTTVRTEGRSAFAVVKLADAPGLARSERQEAGEPPAGFKVAAVRLAYRPVKEIVDAIPKVLSKPGGTIMAVGDGGLVMVSDLSPRVDQVLDLIKLLDVPTTPSTVMEIPVRSITAPALATLAVQVSAKREQVSGEKIPGDLLPSPNGSSVLLICPPGRQAYWESLVASLDKREPAQTVSYAPRTFALAEVAKLIEQTIKEPPGIPADDRWRLVTDELTGTLIVTATPSQHEQIRGLIDRLNLSPTSVQKPVRRFIIKNRPVKDVQAVLEQLLCAGALAPDSLPNADAKTGAQEGGLAPWPPPTAQPQTGSAVQTPAPRPGATAAASHLPGAASVNHAAERVVTFTADEGTNSLMAMAEPRVLGQIDSLLVGLDVRQPQVMLEVLIVSLSDSQTLNLGVELEKQISTGDVVGRLASLFGLGTRGPNGDRTVGDGNGFTGLVLSPGDFSVVLRALQTINDGRSLSMPRVLAANNKEAVLDSTLTQPFANTNASNTVTTTSFGGDQEAGTQVTLKPQIGAGDQLNLEYSISLSAFVGAPASPNLPPPRQQNKVQSAASLPDGYTVAVGGIELTSDGQGISQVPGIGSIPILGEAFKSRSRNTSRSRFFVFIRANVLRNQSYEDLKYLSDSAAQTAGIDDGFPVVEPRVMR